MFTVTVKGYFHRRGVYYMYTHISTLGYGYKCTVAGDLLFFTQSDLLLSKQKTKNRKTKQEGIKQQEDLLFKVSAV